MLGFIFFFSYALTSSPDFVPRIRIDDSAEQVFTRCRRLSNFLSSLLSASVAASARRIVARWQGSFHVFASASLNEPDRMNLFHVISDGIDFRSYWTTVIVTAERTADRDKFSRVEETSRVNSSKKL